MNNISVSLNIPSDNDSLSVTDASRNPGIYVSNGINFVSFGGSVYQIASDNQIIYSPLISGIFQAKIADTYVINQNGKISFESKNKWQEVLFYIFPCGSIIEWGAYPNDLFMVVDCGPNLVNIITGVHYNPSLPQKFRLVGKLQVEKN